RAMHILFDIHIDNEKFSLVIELAKALCYGGLAEAYGLYLRPGKYNSGYVLVQQLKFKAGTFVLYVDLFLHKDCKSNNYCGNCVLSILLPVRQDCRSRITPVPAQW